MSGFFTKHLDKDGSITLHGIVLNEYKGKFSCYYDKNRKLIDVDQLFQNRESRSVNKQRCPKLWNKLQRLVRLNDNQKGK